MSKLVYIAFACLVAAGIGMAAGAAEHVVLDAQNWNSYVPAGKEVDCIYGDHVLRSNRLVAVVASAADTRNANMTVKGVGGSLIDLTQRDVQSDQLSCYYPHGNVYKIAGPVEWPSEMPATEGAARIAFELHAPADATAAMSKCKIVVGYELADGDDYLSVHSLVTNDSDAEQSIDLMDGVRADGEFKFDTHSELNLWWCQDDYWRQAYGVTVRGGDWAVGDKAASGRRPRQVRFTPASSERITLKPGESVLIERQLFAAADTFELLAKVASLHSAATGEVAVSVVSADGPVSTATVKAVQDSKVVASGQTDEQGKLVATLPVGEYQWVVESRGRKHQDNKTVVAERSRQQVEVELPPLGRVTGRVSDGSGEPIPCRVAFFGQNVSDPSFGPDSAIHGVRNLWHTANGEFDVQILPGVYEVVISYGPEYDAVIETIEVTAGETSQVAAELVRSVDTSGWLSAELHSHSSPSGDNTASQRGRVLNLLVEHLEFIPCTEHQRISTYLPHLEHFDAMHRVLTCSGMELTGQPLPINHQNAFPLIQRPNTQDGGGPTIHVDPVVQIERLAMWDNNSDKVVQINHPNIRQMIGDRDLDGQADEGFRKMFAFADVMEVHPLGTIFDELSADDPGRGNTVKQWMQMLNLGYRVPGVVNTDAHWNYYGSGWLRNYVRSGTDNPAEAELMDICHALERGQVVMTNGPFLQVEATAGDETVGPGDDLHAEGLTPRFKLRVECPNWLDVNRVQVMVNGRPDADRNFLRADGAAGFGTGTVKFEHEFDLPLDRDAHVIVVAAAEGRQLGHVYGPDRGSTMPIAVSNPVFIDVDGGGFQANGDTLGLPLPVKSDHKPTHGHDHGHTHDHTHGHDHPHPH